jgi:hypothetical protein
MKYLLAIAIILGLNGCYTVIWLPEEKLPQSYQQNEFYNYDYYGDYSEFYSTPWWIINPINIYHPSQSINHQKEREKKSSNLRNEVGERLTTDRESYSRENYTPPISTINSTSVNAKNNTNNNSGSRSTSTNEESSRNNSNSDNSGSLRNENGNRNSGNNRR